MGHLANGELLQTWRLNRGPSLYLFWLRPRSAKEAGFAGYGWHGTRERSTDTPAGLALMGAPLHNPATGLFASTDPV